MPGFGSSKLSKTFRGTWKKKLKNGGIGRKKRVGGCKTARKLVYTSKGGDLSKSKPKKYMSFRRPFTIKNRNIKSEAQISTSILEQK